MKRIAITLAIVGSLLAIALFLWRDQTEDGELERRASESDARRTERALWAGNEATEQEPLAPQERDPQELANMAGALLAEARHKQVYSTKPAAEADVPEGASPAPEDPSPDDPSQVTAAESRILDLYEQLVARLSRAQTCSATESGITAFVETNMATFKALEQEREGLDESATEQARQRLENAARNRLSVVREALRSSLAKCPMTPDMKKAFGELAATNVM